MSTNSKNKNILFDNYDYDALSSQIWSDNYKAPKEQTRTDTWNRLANACASVESDEIKEKIENGFKTLLFNDQFVPGGRIIANLGVDNRLSTTLYNCYVHNPKDIDLQDCDSIEGIYSLLKAQALTLKSEGGYGINASFIRPAGSYVVGIGSRTPGVLKFMELWDKSSEIITMGSTKILGEKKPEEKNKIRKGAQMLVLDVWHPDIKDFIVAKQTEGRLTKFNMSVGITEGFMEALIKDETWELKYPDTEHAKYKTEWFGDIKEWESKGYPVIVHETCKASEIWELIMKSTYNRNEPGVLFLDIANKLNPVHWFDSIKTTNPCFSGETLVAVADGRNAVTIKQLAEEEKDVPVYSLNPKTGIVEIKTARNPRITGYNKKLVRVTLDDGSHFDVTPDHKCLLKNGTVVLAKDLQYGDSLPRFNKKQESTKKNGKPYWQLITNLNNPVKSRVFEHRLVAKFNYPEVWNKNYIDAKNSGWHKGGLVVHHKDYNGLNNRPENLQVMTFKEHQQFHADHDCHGENNGRFLGKQSEEIKQKALQLTKNLGRRFSEKEWIKFAKENELPVQFSKMHHKVLGKTQAELAHICALELGFCSEVGDTRLLKTLKNMLKLGYEAKIDKNQVLVTKTCEGCSANFHQPHEKREISFCSYDCYAKNGMNDFYKQRAEKVKNDQARIWSKLHFELKRNPQKKEWTVACKKENIPVRLGGTKHGFQYYKEVGEAGLNYNHKVVSVEELPGTHNVYNLTVDDNHTVSIVTNCKEKKDKPISYSGIHVYNCGEIPMSTGVCNLGSINLTQFVIEDEEKIEFDYEAFAEAVELGIRFLDNINDISTTPLPEYSKSVKEKRRIGLGVMGLGSLHTMMAIKYGSEKSQELVKNIFQKKSETELLASAKLGKEKGSFEKFDKEKYFNSYWWKGLEISQDIKDEIEKIGCMRNSHQSMNAPTGNTGIYARNVSGGIEPVFNTDGYYRWSIVPEFQRRQLIKEGFIFPDVYKGEWFETDFVKFDTRGDETILKGTFDGKNYEIDKNRGLTVQDFVEDYGIKFAKKFYKDFAKMKKQGAFTSAQNLTVEEHLNVLKEASKYTNMAISKTVNVPEDYDYEDFKDLYLNAWKNNLKGITTYRAGTMTAVLEAKTDKKTKEKENKFIEHGAPKRPEKLPCDIFHMTVRGEKWNMFIGLYDDKPYEIFAGRSKYIHLPKSRKTGTIKKNGVYNLYTGEDDNEIIVEDLATVFENSTESAFTRTISLALRHGAPVQYVVEQLEKGADKDSDMFSLAKALVRVLKKYISDGTKPSQKKCINCDAESLIYSEGCILCKNCGFSKCG